MKRRFLYAGLILAVCGGLMTSSCIGKFALTNKLLTWNKGVGSKFVNELVFFAFWILPVYEVSALADLLVLNSIEFWSGNNPIAKGTKVIDGENGRYLVKCDGKGYTITCENDGSEVRLDFNEEELTWTLVTDDTEYELMTFIDDTHVALPAPDGSRTVVELSDNGLMAYRALARDAVFMAAR